MADPFGDDELSGGAGKRPAPTIEGTATEVSAAAPGEEADGSILAGHDDAPAEQEPEDDAKENAPEAEAAPTTSEREPEETEPEPVEAAPELSARTSPPPAATISEMKSFVTHLAAGLLGGLIGVIALAFAWHLLPGAQSDKAAPDLAKLEARIAKLESSPPSAPAPDIEAVAKLDDRVKTLEDRAPETPPELPELTGRVAQMELAFKALAEAAKDGGSVPDAAAISQQVGEAEQRLQTKLDKALADAAAANASSLQAMQASLDELKAKVGQLAEAGLGGDASPDVTALNERIAKLEAVLPGLEGAIDKSVAGTKSATAALAFANLRAAVADGRPYAEELATIKSFVPDPEDLEPLPAYADKGIPTVPELARSFAAAEDAALADATPAGSGSIIDRLLASAATIVKVKRVDEAATGDSPSAVLARAQALIDKGDFAGSVQQIETLQGAPRDAFSAWLADARARLGADDVVKRLEATLLASMGAPNKAQK